MSKTKFKTKNAILAMLMEQEALNKTKHDLGFVQSESGNDKVVIAKNIRFEGNVEATGDIAAFSGANPPVPNWWNSMPIAGKDVRGGIKVDNSTFSVDDNGYLILIGQVGTPDQTLSFNQTNKLLSISGVGGNAVDLSTLGVSDHTHTEAEISDLKNYALFNHTHDEYASSGHGHTLDAILATGNSSRKGLLLKSPDGTKTFSIGVTNDGHLSLQGGANGNVISSGDLLAFSAGSAPADWWGNMPPASRTAFGGIKIDGSSFSLDANGFLKFNKALGNPDQTLSFNSSTGALSISGSGNSVNLSSLTPSWANISGKPTTFPPSAHNHDGLYLGLNAKAKDSDKLDGLDASSFYRQVGLIDPNTQKSNGWFKVSGTHTNNPFRGTGASGFGSFESTAHGFQIIGPDAGPFRLKGRTYANGTYGAWVEMWHSGNDGSGSGLDADKLDGLQATDFSRSNHHHNSQYHPKSGNVNTPITASQVAIKSGIFTYDAVKGEIVLNKPIRVQGNIYGEGNVIAFASGGDSSNIIDSIPNASATVRGLVKIGSGITATNGVISVDNSAFNPSLSLNGNTLSINSTSIDLSSLSPDLSGYATENFVNTKLGGLNSTQLTRSDVYSVNDFNQLTANSRITSINAAANTPFGSAWYTVYNNRHRGGTGDGGAYGSQIAIGMTSHTNRIAFRNQNQNTWGSWKELIHTENISTQTVAKAGSADNSTKLNNIASNRFIFGDNHRGSDDTTTPINNIRKSGFYRTNAANELKHFIHLQHPGADTYSFQIGNLYEKNELRFRGQANGVWGHTHRIWHSGNANHSTANWRAQYVVASDYQSANAGSLIRGSGTVAQIARSTVNIGGVELYHNQVPVLKTDAVGVVVNTNGSSRFWANGKAGQWGYVRYQSGASLYDIAIKDTDGHFLQFRPKGSHVNRTMFDQNGKWTFGNEVKVNTGLIGSYDEDLYLRRAGTNKLILRSSYSESPNRIEVYGADSGKRLNIGGAAANRNANMGCITLTNGNLHIDAATGYGTYIEHYNKGFTQFGGEIRLKDANTKILEGAGNSVKIQTNSGYIDIGAQNTSWAHIYSNKRFLFNQALTIVGGTVSSYGDSDLFLKRNYSTKFTLGSSANTSHQQLNSLSKRGGSSRVVTENDLAHYAPRFSIGKTSGSTASYYYKIASWTQSGSYQSGTLKLQVTSRTEGGQPHDYYVTIGFETKDSTGNIGNVYLNKSGYYYANNQWFYRKSGKTVELWYRSNATWRHNSATVVAQWGHEPTISNTESTTAPSGLVESYNNLISRHDATFNGHIYGRHVNGQYSNLYKFGGIYLTWDSDSYGTNTHHSIRSTHGDTYGDSITLNSFKHLRINLDSNNNNTDARFEIGANTTGTGNTRFWVDESGNTWCNGNLKVGAGKHIDFNNGSTYRMREATGSYGTVAVYGKKNGWGGYSIEGRYNFMANGDVCGIYNDVDNEWMALFRRNGASELYQNGSKKLETNASGVKVTGALTATGNVTAYSDKRLKSDVKELVPRGELNPVIYKKDDRQEVGFIAQEVREVYPELVLGQEKEDEFLSLNYGQLTAVLCAEIKSLKKEITELKNSING